jgi:hypothetical protein
METYAEKFIEEISKTELDLDFPYYSSDSEECNEVLTPISKMPYVQVPSMNIEEAIEALQALQSAGANRVYIVDHVDHHGYYFYGTLLKKL